MFTKINPAAGSADKTSGFSLLEKKKQQKIDFMVRSETTKKEVLKNFPPKKSPSSRRIYFFAAFPNFFFHDDSRNRFRLPELGGVEPLRGLLRAKPLPGEAVLDEQLSGWAQPSRNLLGIVRTHRACRPYGVRHEAKMGSTLTWPSAHHHPHGPEKGRGSRTDNIRLPCCHGSSFVLHGFSEG